MIVPPDFRGVAFGGAGDGDGRVDLAARRVISAALGVPARWATVHQVHGAQVRWADAPGTLGEGDAIATCVPALPLAIGTADCLPVAIEGDDAIALAHAGWRGLAAGVVAAAVTALRAAGADDLHAAIGPGIGPCCYEVGPEVVETLAGHEAETMWGTPSVDLVGAAAAQLGDMRVWRSDECTRCGEGWHSYRRERSAARQVALAWLPG